PDKKLISHTADALLGHLWIRRAGLTYVVYVGVNSTSPQKVAMIANAYMDDCQKKQLDDQTAAVSRANHDIVASLEKMRQDAESTQAALQEYKNAHGLLDAEGATMSEQEVSTLNQQIAAAKADAAEK